MNNQEAWVRLFEQHKIIDVIDRNGYFNITADQIKVVREPRLMTKIDHSAQLPKILKDNKITIIPTARGEYRLGRYNVFHKIEKPAKSLESLSFENNFESIDLDNITSESISITCTSLSGILSDFLNEENLTRTVSGKMSSDSFKFNISGVNNCLNPIHVDCAQIEIDAGFEGKDSLALIEAKNLLSEDFIVRQLYYPFRKWRPLIKKKLIRNLFLTYSNGVFILREYAFEDVNEYNSIKLIKHQRYAICNYKVNIESIRSAISEARKKLEPNAPFPQADSFARVMNLCELLSERETLKKDEITEEYAFDERQTDYYINACKYLDLVIVNGDEVKLTKAAADVFHKHIQLRRKFFIDRLVEKKVFREALELYLNSTRIPSIDQVVGIMKTSKLCNVESEKTYRRRASTVRSWIGWIIDQIEV